MDYANASKEKAQENYNKHEMNPLGETIIGKTNSSVMTGNNSTIIIAKLQNTYNQIDNKSPIAIGDFRTVAVPFHKENQVLFQPMI